jgi:RNA polymerase sigma-70 factor (ECF subfamily)
MKEQVLFDRYKTNPSAGTLVGVLRASQDRIYNLCLRVLGQPQDAEDASQKVFLRLLDLVGTLKDGEHYERMVSRVCFQVAVDEVRARSTRRVHERRKSEMPSDELASQTPSDVTPLYEHLARLDDGSRGLLVDHYMEGKSLETIARTWGCSRVAVWKRLEKARAALRLSLSGAGFSAMGMESLLEAAPLVTAPRDLVSVSILEKAARVAGAGVAPVHPSLGGMIMAGKSVSSAVGIAVLLAAIVGGGVLLCFRGGDSPLAAGSRVRKTEKLPVLEGDTGPVAKDSKLTQNEAAAAPKAEKESLGDRLKRFREVVLAARGGKSEELYLKMSSESEKLRPEVLAHPAEYLAFLRAGENEVVLDDLTNIVFWRYSYRRVKGVLTSVGDLEMMQAANNVPREILDGVFELAKTGSTLQKAAALSVLPSHNSSGWDYLPLMDLCTRLLEDPNPAVADAALTSIRNGDPDRLREHTDSLARMLENLRQARGVETSFEMSCGIQGCLIALASVDSAKSDEALARTLEEALQRSDRTILGTLETALSFKRRSLTAEAADRTAPLLTAALRTTSDPNAFRTLLELSLRIQLRSATPILESGLTFAPTPELRENLEDTLKQIRQGERGIENLRETLERRRERRGK